ncbi:Oidioi.mRNA.OKI2018_I69.PAR.g9483.t1.cds [Oikopleura dioica]|uniref:Oidioi.mRNA.OKI2018_I69.PAR.g9483.t1.cds n=1 Tax=Oikopleura dioica TaxID=34765 RepID=A0ABN7RRN4_OIKDI|nr:Oidioi.mRNA.OKI2018_I69.PAR.g9483.t1.cds [Oikopleura dioica]
MIYLNKNNLGSWELPLYRFVQSVRLKTLVVHENSWLGRLMPNSPKIVLFDSWNSEIQLPKDENTRVETSFATKVFARPRNSLHKKLPLSRLKKHVFHVISCSSTHDADMIRFLQPECPVYFFDAPRLLIAVNNFYRYHQLPAHPESSKDFLSLISSQKTINTQPIPSSIPSSNPFMELLPHAGLLGLVSLGIYESLVNENSWISSADLVEHVVTLHNCLNIDDLLSISNVPETCQDVQEYFLHQIRSLWKEGYLVSENSTLFSGWWDLEQDQSSGQKLFAINSEKQHKQSLYAFGLIIQPFLERMMDFCARRLKKLDVEEFGRENEWLKTQEYEDEELFLTETLDLLIYYDLRK